MGSERFRHAANTKPLTVPPRKQKLARAPGDQFYGEQSKGPLARPLCRQEGLVHYSAMPKKLQVFVSSTFIDMKDERQAAVEAILQAGHIPAGMELFTAGNKSQWEVIKRWIKESDAFMLVLGSFTYQIY